MATKNKCGANYSGYDNSGKYITECPKPAGHGTQHPGFGRCSAHGGSSPNGNVSASVDAFTMDVRERIGRMTIIPVDDPLTEMAKLAGEAIAWKDVIAERVSFLNDIRYDGEKTGEQVRGEVIVFERALDRCNAVLTNMAKLNIDERLARVSEKQAEFVANALTAALNQMGLTLEQQREAKSLVADQLRLVAG